MLKEVGSDAAPGLERLAVKVALPVPACVKVPEITIMTLSLAWLKAPIGSDERLPRLHPLSGIAAPILPVHSVQDTPVAVKFALGIVAATETGLLLALLDV